MGICNGHPTEQNTRRRSARISYASTASGVQDLPSSTGGWRSECTSDGQMLSSTLDTEEVLSQFRQLSHGRLSKQETNRLLAKILGEDIASQLNQSIESGSVMETEEILSKIRQLSHNRISKQNTDTLLTMVLAAQQPGWTNKSTVKSTAPVSRFVSPAGSRAGSPRSGVPSWRSNNSSAANSANSELLAALTTALSQGARSQGSEGVEFQPMERITTDDMVAGMNGMFGGVSPRPNFGAESNQTSLGPVITEEMMDPPHLRLRPSSSHPSKKLATILSKQVLLPLDEEAETDDEEAEPSKVQIPGWGMISMTSNGSWAPIRDMGPSEVIPGKLYLGNVDDANDEKKLRELGITHILSVTSGRSLIESPEFTKLHLPMADKGRTDLTSEKVERMLDFMVEAQQPAKHNGEKKNKLLVHCTLGQNRSPTIVILYLVKVKGMSLIEACELVKTCRNLVQPHPEYIKQAQSCLDSLHLLFPSSPSVVSERPPLLRAGPKFGPPGPKCAPPGPKFTLGDLVSEFSLALEADPRLRRDFSTGLRERSSGAKERFYTTTPREGAEARFHPSGLKTFVIPRPMVEGVELKFTTNEFVNEMLKQLREMDRKINGADSTPDDFGRLSLLLPDYVPTPRETEYPSMSACASPSSKHLTLSSIVSLPKRSATTRTSTKKFFNSRPLRRSNSKGHTLSASIKNLGNLITPKLGLSEVSVTSPGSRTLKRFSENVRSSQLTHRLAKRETYSDNEQSEEENLVELPGFESELGFVELETPVKQQESDFRVASYSSTYKSGYGVISPKNVLWK